MLPACIVVRMKSWIKSLALCFLSVVLWAALRLLLADLLTAAVCNVFADAVKSHSPCWASLVLSGIINTGRPMPV